MKIKFTILLTFILIFIPIFSFAAPPTSIQEGNNIVNIPIPVDAATHFQVSLDNINWSDWYIKTNYPTGEVEVTLPVGDGYKNIFIQTGVETEKTFPVYSPNSPSKVAHVGTGEKIYEPTGNIKAYKYLLDLTPPTVEIRTEDNMFVGQNGKINFIVDVTDNLDKAPMVMVEIYSRYTTGAKAGKLITDPAESPVIATINKGLVGQQSVKSGSVSIAGKMVSGETSFKIPLADMIPLKVGTGLNQKASTYILKITVMDGSKNRNVISKPFYIKN